jgi:hypothetical protein
MNAAKVPQVKDSGNGSSETWSRAPNKRGDTTKRGHPTGPRTLRGKERSSRNAVKHGVFSGDILFPAQWNKLPAECRKLYRSLVSSRRPETPEEKMLVEIIATTFFRWRTVLRLHIQLLQHCEPDPPSDEFIRAVEKWAIAGFFDSLPEKALNALLQVSREETDNFRKGENLPPIPPALLVREENRRLELFEQTIDKLQRYEAHLWRILSRAMSALERLQRMRLGDRVPAPPVVDIQN